MSKAKWHERVPKWMWIGGLPAAMAGLIFCAKIIVAWAEVPGRVDSIEQYIQAQVQANEIQRKANDLMEQRIRQQQPQIYCETDLQGTQWCWDEYSQSWYQP